MTLSQLLFDHHIAFLTGLKMSMKLKDLDELQAKPETDCQQCWARHNFH